MLFRSPSAGYEGLNLVYGEHDGRKFEGWARAVAHSCGALNRNAGDRKVSDVSVNGPDGYLQPVGDLGWGAQAPATQILDNSKEAVRASHKVQEYRQDN